MQRTVLALGHIKNENKNNVKETPDANDAFRRTALKELTQKGVYGTADSGG